MLNGASNCIEILEPTMESIQGLEDFSASFFDLLHCIRSTLLCQTIVDQAQSWLTRTNIPPSESQEVPNITCSASFL
jgi:hypothetical protein